MALIDVLKNKAVSAVTGVALKKVRGFLEDTVPNTSKNKNSEVKDQAVRESKPATTGILQFPNGVQSGAGVGNQGHYVMFYILSTEGSELGARERVRNSAKDMERAMSTANLPENVKEPSSFVKEAVSVVREVSELAGSTLIDKASKFSSLIPLGSLQGSASELRSAINSAQTKLQQGLTQAQSELDSGLTNLQGKVGKLSDRAQSLELANQTAERLSAVVEEPVMDVVSQAKNGIKKATQVTEQLNADFSAEVHAQNLQSKSDTRGFTIQRPARASLQTAIALYMPQEVNVRYGANWNEAEIGVLAQSIANTATRAGSGEDLTAALQGGVDPTLDALKASLTKNTLKIIGELGVTGALEAFEVQQGVVVSDRFELAFRRIDRRSFSYVFTMIPKSREEAETIRDIVQTFKENMMPEFLGDDQSGRRLKYPNTFEIEYMYEGQENQFLHKISECALVSMDVKYGGGRYRTFRDEGDGPPPVETTMSLTFQELEILSKDRVKEGY